MDRLQKIIAESTSLSRRKAEDAIRQERVLVNGKVAKIGDKADPESDRITLDGKAIKPASRKLYILLNKPRGYLCTASDPGQRKTVMDLIRTRERIYPVGRLDMYSTGLLIMTNDGALAYKVTHAGRHCPKVYLVKVNGIPDEKKLDRLRRGITVEEERFGPCEIQRMRAKSNSYTWLKVTLFEGKKRQIRRMFEAVGHSIFQLKRVSIGPVTDADLPPGAFRYLTEKEIAYFLALKIKDKKTDFGQARKKRVKPDTEPS